MSDDAMEERLRIYQERLEQQARDKQPDTAQDLVDALLNLRAAFERHDLEPPAGLTFNDRSEIFKVVQSIGPTVPIFGERTDKLLGFEILQHPAEKAET